MRIDDKKELYSLILENKVVLKDLGVRRLGVFGSFARGTTQARSDIDLLVEFAPGILKEVEFFAL